MSFGMYIKLEFRIFNVFFTTRINTHVSQIWPTSCQHSSSVWFNLKQSSQSDSSVIELDSDFVFIVLPTNTSVLLSPPSPVDLRSNFSNVALSSQASEESDIPASDVLVPGKKRVYKIHRGRFHKGQNVKRRPLTTSSPKNRLSSNRPKSKLFQYVKLPQPNKRYTLKIPKDDTHSFGDLYVHHGYQIMDMDIVSTVFSLLKCTDVKYSGSLNLYQMPFVMGCRHTYYWSVVTAISWLLSSLLGSCEPQCTSVSWSDFLLTCNILGIQNAWHHMPTSAQSQVVLSTKKICGQSMSPTAKHVHMSGKTSNIPDCKTCTVSFDATRHPRGYYSNQGFEEAIEVYSGKVLEYVLYESICNKCLRWTEERKKDFPEEFSEYWEKHSSECPANFSGSSQAMDSWAALKIWARSIRKHCLVYTTHVGDGDSSSFKLLVESDPYKGIEAVLKEEFLDTDKNA